jgi:hypothetical protein
VPKEFAYSSNQWAGTYTPQGHKSSETAQLSFILHIRSTSFRVGEKQLEAQIIP